MVGEKASGEYSIGPDYKVDAVLAGTVARLREEGIDIAPHGPKGDPADAIVEVAVREGADLIVLGSKGMQGARRILGSIPNKVSHSSPCDLLIVQTIGSRSAIEHFVRDRRTSTPSAGRRHPGRPHVDALAAERHPLRLEQPALALSLSERAVGPHHALPGHVRVVA